MATEIYGRSDDLVEFEGDVSGECGYYAPEDDADGGLIVCSDGTLLVVKYGKPGLGGVWGLTLLKAGDLFDRIEVCTDEDAERHSDTAHFKDGMKSAWFAARWEKVA
jgi:hypothetical protein